MNINISPPDGWRVLVDELSKNGVYTLQHKTKNVKIHCNKLEDSYRIVMVHPIDGPTAETTAKPEEVNDAITRVSNKLSS